MAHAVADDEVSAYDRDTHPEAVDREHHLRRLVFSKYGCNSFCFYRIQDYPSDRSYPFSILFLKSICRRRL